MAMMFKKNTPGMMKQVDGKASIAKQAVLDEQIEDYKDVIGIYIGIPGDLEIILKDMEESVIFKNITPGVIHPILVKEIVSGGTSAEDILLIYN